MQRPNDNKAICRVNPVASGKIGVTKIKNRMKISLARRRENQKIRPCTYPMDSLTARRRRMFVKAFHPAYYGDFYGNNNVSS